MLQQSFSYLPGIGPTKEQALWSHGILHWDQLDKQLESLFKEGRAEEIRGRLKEGRRAYRSSDLFYFYQHLPREHLWRLVPECREKIAYLDIETTGTGYPPLCHSTTITFYFKGELYQEYSHAAKKKLIRKMLKEASMLCTFFGEGFDVPFLRAEFDVEFRLAHLDLCFWFKRLGFKGGLKKIQKCFSEIPDRQSMDIDGYDAVRLWRMHERGVPGALETLLTYNAEDTVVLEALLAKGFNLELQRNPELGRHFGMKELSMPSLPELGTRVYPEVYALLRGGTAK